MSQREEQYREVRIHMDGIETVVKMRGGLKAIGLNHFLTHMVLWVDQLYAALTQHKPRFQPASLFSKTTYFPPSPTSLLRPKGLPPHALTPPLNLILHQLCAASQFLVDIDPHMSDADFYAFGVKRTFISDALLHLRPGTPIEHCARDAAILYVLTALTNMNCEVCRDLVAGLRRQLAVLDFETVNAEAPGLLLWMALVGGGAAPPNADRAWFVEVLGWCLRSRKWTEVEERLEGWPWRPKYCESWRLAWRDAVSAASFIRVVEVIEPVITACLEYSEQRL